MNYLATAFSYLKTGLGYVQSALDYAYNNYGRVAAILVVLAPAAHLSLSNTEANTLAEIVLFLIFLFEEVVRALRKAWAQ